MGLENDRLCLTDDDLTNLNWLQDGNLLKNVTDSVLNNSKMTSNTKKESEESEKLSAQVIKNDQTLPQNESKPPFSFSCLIFMAIESSPQKALPVKQIYSWITDHFPFYRSAAGGWKNTVRHNLSLNRCFRKVSSVNDSLSVGKGSLWSVVPTYRQALLNSIRSTSESSNRHYLPTKTMMRPELDCVPFQLQMVINKAVVAKPYLNREEDEAVAAECMLSLTQIHCAGLNHDNSSRNENESNSTIMDHDYTKKSEPSTCYGMFGDDEDERKGAEALLNLSKRHNL